jgi:hypothetical protein
MWMRPGRDVKTQNCKSNQKQYKKECNFLGKHGDTIQLKYGIL